MDNKRLIFGTFMLATAFSTLIAPRSAVAQVEEFYTVIVQAGAGPDGLTRLKMFHKEMRKALRVTDLGYRDIGCDKCADLESGPPETSLTFVLYRENKKGFNAFFKSYRAVQTNQGHETFSMLINGLPPPGAACPSPLPADCGPRQICIQTNKCDSPLPVGGSCGVCSG